MSSGWNKLISLWTILLAFPMRRNWWTRRSSRRHRQRPRGSLLSWRGRRHHVCWQLRSQVSLFVLYTCNYVIYICTWCMQCGLIFITYVIILRVILLSVILHGVGLCVDRLVWSSSVWPGPIRGTYAGVTHAFDARLLVVVSCSPIPSWPTLKSEL